MRYDYNKTEIIAEWRKDKETGWGQRIAKKLKVPVAVVFNVIYAHRRKRKEYNANYRAKVTGLKGLYAGDPQTPKVWNSRKAKVNFLSSFVAYAAPNMVSKAFDLVEG